MFDFLTLLGAVMSHLPARNLPVLATGFTLGSVGDLCPVQPNEIIDRDRCWFLKGELDVEIPLRILAEGRPGPAARWPLDLVAARQRPVC